MAITLEIIEDGISGDLTTQGDIKKSEAISCAALLIDMASRVLHMSTGMEDTEFVKSVIVKVPKVGPDGAEI